MGDAIFKQQNGLLAVGLVGSCGILTPEQLAGAAALAGSLGIAGWKLSSRQTLIAILPEENLAKLRDAVTPFGLRIGVFGEVIRNVKACCGTNGFCRRTQANAHEFGVRLQDKFMDQPVPKDFKISVAGCARGCTDPYCADFGLMANSAKTPGGYDVIIGGRGGSRKPRHGVVIAESVSPEAAERILEFVLARYRELGEAHERFGLTIDRVGRDKFAPPAELLDQEAAAAGDKVDTDFMSMFGQ